MPEEVRLVFDTHPDLRNPKLLIGVVEHRVELDTVKTPSQNDLWCMVLTDSGQVSVAVEGKSGEDFDKTLADWIGQGSLGKERRLAFLCDVLKIQAKPDLAHRYQLFHRAASAILEARRWNVDKAVMLVQSFSESQTSWQDYVKFAALLGVSVARNTVSAPVSVDAGRLYLAWVDSPLASDASAAHAL